VSPRALGEHLADHRNLTVMLRLVVDPTGHLMHGELIDLDGSSHGRFLNWERLIELLTVRLEDTSI
jgi:hypothetical protein